jgi:hypothetical protein
MNEPTNILRLEAASEKRRSPKLNKKRMNKKKNKKTVFDVTFGGNYRTINCLKIAASSPEEAVKIAEVVLRENPTGDSNLPKPAGYIAAAIGMGLMGSSLFEVRPETDRKFFDMTDIKLDWSFEKDPNQQGPELGVQRDLPEPSFAPN